MYVHRLLNVSKKCVFSFYFKLHKAYAYFVRMVSVHTYIDSFVKYLRYNDLDIHESNPSGFQYCTKNVMQVK